MPHFTLTDKHKTTVERLCRMFNSGFKESHEALKNLKENGHSTENLYQAAFAIYRLVKPMQCHFMLGNEDLFLDSMRLIRDLAVAAAEYPDADAQTLNFAGVLLANSYNFTHYPGLSPLKSHMEQATKYFASARRLAPYDTPDSRVFQNNAEMAFTLS